MAMTSSLSMVLERGGGRSTKLQHIKIAIAIQYSNGVLVSWSIITTAECKFSDLLHRLCDVDYAD